MRTLTPAQRRALRAKAHHVDASASVGQAGLSASVLREIDVSLRAHELVKIRVFAAEREARDAMLISICDALDAAPVQHLGKVLIVWRPAPDEEAAAPPAKAAAKRQPQARRPRSPLPRTPARPVPAAPPPPRGKGRRGAARHASGNRDADLPGASPESGARRKSTYTPKTTPKSFSAKPNPRSAWAKKPPAPRAGKPVGSRISSGKPRGGKPLGFTRGAKPAGTTRRAAPAAASTRRRRKASQA